MPYPVTASVQGVAVGQSWETTFRPEKAGLVNAVVVASGFPASPPPPAPAPQPLIAPGGGPSVGGTAGFHEPPPLDFTVALRLDLVKPGTAEPVASTEGSVHIGPGSAAKNQLVVSAFAPASDADLGGDWVAKVTNTGDSTSEYDLTVRYQVVDGDLGKVDHIVVLMMENRSFDHMLGYLALEGGRSDVDGLTAEMGNPFGGKMVRPHRLVEDGRANRRAPDGTPISMTYFANDPEHGSTEVEKQLQPATDPESGATLDNAGFVQNFADKLQRDASKLPPLVQSMRDSSDIGGGDSREIHFRPGIPGRVTVASAIGSHPGQPPGDPDFLAQISVTRPGVAKPLTSKIGYAAHEISLIHEATDAELAVPGDWTAEIENEAGVPIHFDTRVSYVAAAHDTTNQETPDAILGYYDKDQLPLYDLLAEHFAICDQWYASIPTDTWPNRLYALTGGSGGLATTPSADSLTKEPPGFTLRTIFEVLQNRGVEWKIYFADLPFALIFKALSQDAAYTSRMRSLSDLLEAAETGDLPSLAWVDPKFLDVEELLQQGELANDDHPAGDVARGQHIVWQIYDALSRGPAWAKTLLLITYDEHGGFFDHRSPPGTPSNPNSPDVPPDPIFPVYGVRVPAFVVSPWVAPRSATKDIYDHTSLLATILRRFSPEDIGGMGERVAAARDVGSILSGGAPFPAPPAGEPVLPPAAPAARVEEESFGEVLRKALLGF